MKFFIFEDRSYLIKFLKNLIFKENNPLNNKELHINSGPINNNNDKEIRIIKMMKENPSIRIEEIANYLGVSLRTTKNIIAVLQKQGLVQRENGKKYGYWKVKN